MTQEAKNAYLAKYGISSIDLGLVSEALRNDCPYERYWMGLTINGGFSSTFTARNDGEIKLSFKEVTLNVSFPVSIDYRGSSENTGDMSKTGAVKNTISIVNTIIKNAQNLSDMDKIKYYRDYICDLNTYNDEVLSWSLSESTDRYGNPWQLVYVFDQVQTLYVKDTVKLLCIFAIKPTFWILQLTVI